MSTTLPFWKSRPFLIGAGVAAAYIAVTGGLYLSWWAGLEAFSDGVNTRLDRNDPNWVVEFTRAMENAPPLPVLFNLLSWPIPRAAIAESRGGIFLWPILVQGLWLGAIVWSGLTRFHTWPVFAVLVAVPVVVIFALSGNLIVTVIFGAGPAVFLVGAIWSVTLWFEARALRRQLKNTSGKP